MASTQAIEPWLCPVLLDTCMGICSHSQSEALQGAWGVQEYAVQERHLASRDAARFRIAWRQPNVLARHILEPCLVLRPHITVSGLLAYCLFHLSARTGGRHCTIGTMSAASYSAVLAAAIALLLVASAAGGRPLAGISAMP